MCFKIGHTVIDCIISQRKGCFYCGKHITELFSLLNLIKEVINGKGKIEQHLTPEKNLTQNVELSTSTNVVFDGHRREFCYKQQLYWYN